MPSVYLVSRLAQLMEAQSGKLKLTVRVTHMILTPPPSEYAICSPARNSWGDVLLGLTTGVWAYYLYERRLHRPDGERLADLVRWKFDQRARLAQAAQADSEGWEEIERELKAKEQEALQPKQ